VFLLIENTSDCCARHGLQLFLFRPISLNRWQPPRFAFQILPTRSSRLCSNSHRNRSPLSRAFIQVRLLDQAFSSGNVYQSSPMRSSKTVPKSAMTQLLAREATSDMKQ